MEGARVPPPQVWQCPGVLLVGSPGFILAGLWVTSASARASLWRPWEGPARWVRGHPGSKEGRAERRLLPGGAVGSTRWWAAQGSGQRGKPGSSPGRGGLPVAAQAGRAQALLPGFPGTAQHQLCRPQVPIGPQGRAAWGQGAPSAELSGVDHGPGISEGLKPPALSPWCPGVPGGRSRAQGELGTRSMHPPAPPCTGVNPSPRLPTHRDGTETPPT